MLQQSCSRRPGKIRTPLSVLTGKLDLDQANAWVSQDGGSHRKHLWQMCIGHQEMWLQKLLMVFRKTYLQVHLAGGAASLTLAGKLCRTNKSIFSCLRFSCSPWYSQGLRPKHGNNATNVSGGLACCLYPSGQPWEWMTALSMLVGHQGIPFHTMNLWYTLDIHVFVTCITAVQSIQWV